MPNFVKVDAKPFHPDAYMGPEHDDDDSQQGETLRERSMSIKLRVENTVRWRWIKDEYGQDVSPPHVYYKCKPLTCAADPSIKRASYSLVRRHS